MLYTTHNIKFSEFWSHCLLRNENIKYFISSGSNQTHNLSCLLVPLCCHWPQSIVENSSSNTSHFNLTVCPVYGSLSVQNLVPRHFNPFVSLCEYLLINLVFFRVTILCNKFDGHPKGFAYIEFGDKDSVQTAMAMDESLFRGRQIKVSSLHFTNSFVLNILFAFYVLYLYSSA